MCGVSVSFCPKSLAKTETPGPRNLWDFQHLVLHKNVTAFGIHYLDLDLKTTKGQKLRQAEWTMPGPLHFLEL